MRKSLFSDMALCGAFKPARASTAPLSARLKQKFAGLLDGVVATAKASPPLAKALLHTAATAVFLTASGSASATVYYVSSAGSDINPGLTQSAPLKQIQTAVNLTKPGDTVYVMTGVYTSPPALWHNAVVQITTSGTPANPITIEALPGQHPIISTYANPKVWDAVSITASYINFEGFEIVGNAQNVTLAQATATAAAEEALYLASAAVHAANASAAIVTPADALTNGSCIAIQNAIHVVIKKNLVHDCSASGISAQMTDYITIGSNVVFNTSWWTVYDTSGINVHQMLNSDNQTGYKVTIVNNISHDNANTQAYYNLAVGGGVPTDGNGIIIDTNQVTNDGQPYLGRTLIMGNIVYNNGGSGMHAYLSKHVDMFNNTAYMNNTCPVPGSTCGALNEGQIFGSVSSDINIYNNIMYSPANYWTYSNWENTSITEGHNLLFSAGGKVLVRNNYTLNNSDQVTDPLFGDAAALNVSSASPAQDAYTIANPVTATWLLRPQAASPARGAGTATLTNGKPMLITPTGMDGVQPSGLSIGALSAPP